MPSRLLLGYIDRKRKERKCIAVVIDSKRTLILHPLSATATPTLFFSPARCLSIVQDINKRRTSDRYFLIRPALLFIFGLFFGGKKKEKICYFCNLAFVDNGPHFFFLILFYRVRLIPGFIKRQKETRKFALREVSDEKIPLDSPPLFLRDWLSIKLSLPPSRRVWLFVCCRTLFDKFPTKQIIKKVWKSIAFADLLKRKIFFLKIKSNYEYNPLRIVSISMRF